MTPRIFAVLLASLVGVCSCNRPASYHPRKQFDATQCRSLKTIDVAFLIDSSRSIKESDFDLMKKTAANMVKELNHQGVNTRNALIRFAGDSQVLYWLDDDQQMGSVYSTFMEMTHAAEYDTNVHLALYQARTQVLNAERRFGARCGVPKVILIITDGQPTEDYLTYNESIAALGDDGTHIFVLGVGALLASTPAQTIAIIFTKGNTARVFKEKDYDNLSVVSDDILNTICTDVANKEANLPKRQPLFTVDDFEKARPQLVRSYRK